MLLLWCLSMIQVFFYYPLGERSFSSPWCSHSNQWFPLVEEFSLNFEKFSISPLQAYSFRCWFSNNSVITFLEGCSASSFVAKVGISFSILSFQWSIFYSLFRRYCDVSLLTHHLELSGSCSFIAYPFIRSVVDSLLVLLILSSIASLFNGVLPESVPSYSSFLTECFQCCSSSLLSFFQFAQPRKVPWFHSLVKEAT